MSKTVAYLRVSTDRQELENQRYEIQQYAIREHYVIDEWHGEKVSGTKSAAERDLGAVLETLTAGDTLIVSEISRLGRRVVPVMSLIQSMIDRDVTIVSVKEGYKFGNDINSKVIAFAFGLAAEIERNLISERTKQALARKRAEGAKLGRPLGSSRPESLKLYGNDERILKLMDKAVSLSAIARLLGVNRKTLYDYIERRDLHKQLRWRRFEKTGV